MTAVGSHDTASAIVGVPATGPHFGYVSCGTWALVGVELDAPVFTDASRQANFTNERGVDGTIRYLRNVMGLWLLSESLRSWNRRGDAIDLRTCSSPPRTCRRGPRVDPTTPHSCPRRHARPNRAACREAGQPVPESPRRGRPVHPRQPRRRVRRRDRRRRAALRPAGRGRARRRRGFAEHAALPAHRGRLRPPGRGGPGRGDRVGEPAGRRRARTGSWRETSRCCGSGFAGRPP